MSKTEKRIHKDEYVNPEWYYAQLANDWFIADAQGDELVMRKMSECGYGETTPQQASIQKYGSIWELNKQQIKVLLGKDYREELFQDWEQRRQQPLREYKEWLKNK
jgi:hypothetical protein